MDDKTKDALLEARDALTQIFAYGDKNDYTSDPWWAITRESKIGTIGEVVLAGPFFSREQAEHQLKNRRYHYGGKARTYCFSGYDSYPYRKLREDAEKALAKLYALLEGGE